MKTNKVYAVRYNGPEDGGPGLVHIAGPNQFWTSNKSEAKDAIKEFRHIASKYDYTLITYKATK